MKEKLKIQPIENGTVIDHLRSSTALQVLKILNPELYHKGEGSKEEIISLAMNVYSPSMERRKDIVKIEGVELTSEETDKITLISPGATINIIRDYDVVKKNAVELPEEIQGIVECSNSNCISNKEYEPMKRREPIDYRFKVRNEDVVRLKCKYCEGFTPPAQEKDISQYLL